MNFLAHYYFLEEKEKELVVLGNLLPDIFPGFSKIYNQQLRGNTAFAESHLSEGISFHLLLDKIFHEHALFHEMCAMAKEEIQATTIDTERKGFVIAHVMIELLLDKILLQRNKDLDDSFYAVLEKVKEQDIEAFCRKKEIVEHEKGIIRKFKSFLVGRYADALKSNEGVALSLQQILGRRIGMAIFEDNQAWTQICVKVEKRLEQDFEDLFQDLKRELKNE